MSELCAAKAMGDSNKGRLHAFSICVEHEQNIKGVIKPGGVVTKVRGVEGIAGALVCGVRYPDRADGSCGDEI
jgi:hypothetical protein